MDYKIQTWWESLSEQSQNLFKEFLYKNSENLGFTLDEETDEYSLN